MAESLLLGRSLAHGSRARSEAQLPPERRSWCPDEVLLLVDAPLRSRRSQASLSHRNHIMQTNSWGTGCLSRGCAHRHSVDGAGGKLLDEPTRLRLLLWPSQPFRLPTACPSRPHEHKAGSFQSLGPLARLTRHYSGGSSKQSHPVGRSLRPLVDRDRHRHHQVLSRPYRCHRHWRPGLESSHACRRPFAQRGSHLRAATQDGTHTRGSAYTIWRDSRDGLD